MSRVFRQLQRAQAAALEATTAPRPRGRPFQVIAVTSNKGGVGKTMVATNLAIYLRALREDLPVLLFSLDDQAIVDRMFAFDAGSPTPSIYDALRAGDLVPAIRLGEYGVHYVRSSEEIASLKQELDHPFHLEQIFECMAWQGIVIVDTKSDLELLTRNAIAASDMTIVVVSDRTALDEAAKVFDMLDSLRRPRDSARVLLSMLDLRIKYKEGESRDILSLLLTEIRRREYPLFESFISRSPKIEALMTNPEGRAKSVLQHAPGTLIDKQMRHLADDVLGILDESPPLPAGGMRTSVRIRGLTPEASQSLQDTCQTIERFPFRIGRVDPLVENDLAIDDHAPWQISRTHVELIERDGRIGVVDLGSHLGCVVDGCPIGGAWGSRGPVFLSESGGTLVVGGDQSRYLFQIAIESA